MTSRQGRWLAAYRAATALYQGNPDGAAKRREYLLFNASRVVTNVELNGELAALSDLRK